jgi:hypothetical protein
MQGGSERFGNRGNQKKQLNECELNEGEWSETEKVKKSEEREKKKQPLLPLLR